MNLLPTLMDNRSVMSGVQIDMSDLKRLEKINLRKWQGAGERWRTRERVRLRGRYGAARWTSATTAMRGGPARSARSQPRRRPGHWHVHAAAADPASSRTMQRASLKSGDTPVFSGFRRAMTVPDRDGIFNYQGGTKEAHQRVNEIVILISPELTEGA